MAPRKGILMERGECSRRKNVDDQAADKQAPADQSASRDEVPDSPQSGTDPVNQSASQLRAIRSGYRNLKSVISDDKENLVRDSQKFDNVTDQVDDLFKKVMRPREQRADLETVNDLSSSLADYVKHMKPKDGPTATDFIAALLSKYGGGDGQFHWDTFGMDANNILREAPGLSTMVGPMDIQPKERRRNLGRKREKPGPVSRPEEVQAAEDSTNSETDKNIETIFKILRTHRSVRFEALVLNRRSFAQTVENIFALSFLVKDGRVTITCEEDGTHRVVPKNAPNAADRASGKVVNTQFVLRLDYKDWLFMKQTLEEGRELVPDRFPTQASSPVQTVPASVTPVRKTSRNRAKETAGTSSQGMEETDRLRPKKMRF